MPKFQIGSKVQMVLLNWIISDLWLNGQTREISNLLLRSREPKMRVKTKKEQMSQNTVLCRKITFMIIMGRGVSDAHLVYCYSI